LTRRGRLVLATAIALIAGVAVAWFAWSQSNAAPTPSIVVGRNPLLDKPAPAISLPTLDGSGTVNLSDYAGRPVIVNFWASWCVPCRQEFPLFKEALTEHAADGLEVLGVVHLDSADSAKQFAADQGATWPLLTDTNNAAWQAYGQLLVPTTYYIDRQGIVRAVSYGPPPSGTLEEQLAKIL
jgi:cytochrome c biogenesis protein CcmG/thiol:disulfide interchange protein DsbE